MDKAPAYGAGDSSFDPWHVHFPITNILISTKIFVLFLPNSIEKSYCRTEQAIAYGAGDFKLDSLQDRFSICVRCICKGS